jgi:hypothetical protein
MPNLSVGTPLAGVPAHAEFARLASAQRLASPRPKTLRANHARRRKHLRAFGRRDAGGACRGERDERKPPVDLRDGADDRHADDPG